MAISLGDGSFSNDSPISSGGGGQSYNDPYEAELAAQAAAGGSGSMLGSGFDYSSGSDDQPSLAELQAATATNTAIRQSLQNERLPQTVTQGFGQGSTPFSQLFARQYTQPMPNIGLLGVTLNSLAGRVPRGISDRLGTGGTPVYDGTGQIVGVMGEGLFGGQAYYGRPGFDPLQTEMESVKDAAGNVIGYKTDSLTGTFGDDDGGEDRLPGVPVAAVTAAAPAAPRAAPEYIYPEGGFFPETGRYYRRGLLDIDPGGLLDFTARNEAFRRGMATDASLYGMPYDLSGYSLL